MLLQLFLEAGLPFSLPHRQHLHDSLTTLYISVVPPTRFLLLHIDTSTNTKLTVALDFFFQEPGLAIGIPDSFTRVIRI